MPNDLDLKRRISQDCAETTAGQIVPVGEAVAGVGDKAAALDVLYTNLATVSGQTITVSSNWGTASDTPSIATNKGWTVTGS